MTKDQLSLKNFMSAYFHEDWTLDAQSTRDVVTQFVHDQQPAELSAIVQALHRLLDGGEDNPTLSRRLFREFGAYFDPLSVGESTSSWLKAIADQIELGLRSRQ